MMGNNRPAGTSTVYHLIHGAFGSGPGPLAVHHLDYERLAGYLLAAVKAQVTWDQAEADIRAYLTAQGVAPDRIEEEAGRACALLQPWLSQVRSPCPDGR